MGSELSRRHALAALGVTSTTIAGCLGVLSDDEADDSTVDDDTDDDSENTSEDPAENGDGPEETTDTGPIWPAIEAGEVLSDFETLSEWEVRTGNIEPAPDEARSGSQAVVLESDGDTAAMSTWFPDGLDFVGWDTSVAIKAESASRIVVEFIAPSNDERLTSVRIVPDEYDDWFRLDCGYEHKPEDEPDLSNVTQLNIIAVGPEDGPTRIVVDDLRRTEAVDNGKAILAFYGGRRSHFEIAADMLEERGWAGAVPVDPRRVGGQNRMSFDELRQLRDRGWDICSYPRADGNLTGMSEEQQRTVIENTHDSLVDLGFENGARHFFAPNWRQMDGTTHDVVRDVHESGFLFGGCPTGAPPTGIHMTPVIWGPALHNGVRRHINLCDQYNQLTVLRIPPIVEDEEDENGNNMLLDDFEHLLDHIEHRGLDVITPSDMVDGTMDRDDDGDDENEAITGDVILDGGRSYSFEGDGERDGGVFDLEDGVLVTEFSHDGESDFVVDLMPSDGGGRTGRLVTTTGTATGESVAIVEEGTYWVDVDADGPWSIDFDQPEIRTDDLTELPVDESGTGPSFVGPLRANGDVRLEATHDGEGDFIVDGFGADGHYEQLINKTGEFDNSRSYSASGAVWINIKADGDWTLTVSDASGGFQRRQVVPSPA